ncbi:MAG: serine/threonine-protein kinase [Myxococcales bacterium]
MEPLSAEARGAPTQAKCAHCGGPFTPSLGDQLLCDPCQGLVPPEPRSHLRESDVAGCKLIHQLGAGRFSTSWLAEAPDGSSVVVKLLHAYAPDPATVQRFLAEVHRVAPLAAMEHPSVAPLLTGGVQLASALFLVYRSGGDSTLADELRSRGRIVASRALELGAQLAEAFGALHAAGVLHLDLKPSNVGLTRDADGTEHAVLLDAATAHLLARADVRDEGPLPLSSAAYISPEEAGGGVAGPRSDLYSLGALLFQCISGRLPVLGSTAGEMVAAHLTQPPLSLRDVGRKAHPQLEAALARALSKDPEQRFGSGEEMAESLRALLPVADRAGAGAEPPAPVPDPIPVLALPAAENGAAAERAARAAEADSRRRFGRARLFVAAAAIAAIALVGAAALRRRAASPAAPSLAAAQAGPELATAPPVAQPAAELAEPEEPATPARAALRRAQLQVTAGDARGAEKTLLPVLAQTGLARRDLSYAMRLMGSAEARRGHRKSAVEWYRKSLHLTDDSAERERVVRIIQRLAHDSTATAADR